jgi:hypothetical protein
MWDNAILLNKILILFKQHHKFEICTKHYIHKYEYMNTAWKLDNNKKVLCTLKAFGCNVYAQQTRLLKNVIINAMKEDEDLVYRVF